MTMWPWAKKRMRNTGLSDRREDQDHEEDLGELPVPSDVLLDDLETGLLIERHAKELGDETRQKAQADGRKRDHRPGFQSELQIPHLPIHYSLLPIH